jgi:hypothetical protein
MCTRPVSPVLTTLLFVFDFLLIRNVVIIIYLLCLFNAAVSRAVSIIIRRSQKPESGARVLTKRWKWLTLTELQQEAKQVELVIRILVLSGTDSWESNNRRTMSSCMLTEIRNKRYSHQAAAFTQDTRAQTALPHRLWCSCCYVLRHSGEQEPWREAPLIFKLGPEGGMVSQLYAQAVLFPDTYCMGGPCSTLFFGCMLYLFLSYTAVCRLSRQCVFLDVSQPYRPRQPVTGIALL